MSAGVTPVIHMSNDMSALTDAVPDNSGWFENDSLDNSGCFDCGADSEEKCLDHGCDVGNDASCGALTILPQEQSL